MPKGRRLTRQPQLLCRSSGRFESSLAYSCCTQYSGRLGTPLRATVETARRYCHESHKIVFEAAFDDPELDGADVN